MTTTPINVLSAAIGALALSLVLVSTGATAPQVVAQELHTPQRVFIENVLDMNAYPNPRDYVVIKQGTPYVVPAGKILVFTALGAVAGGGIIELDIDGFQEVGTTGALTGTGGGIGNACSMKLLPPGFRATAGQTVDLDGNATNARAWGYLVDA